MARELMPASRYEWERVVRRIRMPPTTKLVALTLASYANRDGSQVRPGRGRIAAVVGVTTRTVSRCLVMLRDMGLLDRISKGSGSAFHSATDVYRLTIPVDLLDATEMLDPDERPAKQVTRTSLAPVGNPPEQMTPTSPSKGALSDTRRQEQVTSGTEQVTPVAGVGDTRVHLPTHTNQRPTHDQDVAESKGTTRSATDDDTDEWGYPLPKKCSECGDSGFVGADDEQRPIPCIKCRPHLARVIPIRDRRTG